MTYQSFDVLAIKASHPILDVVAADVQLRRAGATWVGLCPFHEHHKHTPSFVIYPATNTWRCFGQCADGGDVIKYTMKRHNLTFIEACRRLGGAQADGPAPRPAAPAPVVDIPPSPEWQRAGCAFVAEGIKCLQGEGGHKARAYLTDQRLLRAYTIERWRLGLNPGDCWVPFEKWGLPPNPDKPKGLWLPRGIIIPTFDGRGCLWSIHVRRATGEPKYPHITGSKKSLWGVANTDRRMVCIWGGEFDAMLAQQEASHLAGHCSPTTGEGSTWSTNWADAMLGADVVMACYDSDEAGQHGAWAKVMTATGRAVMAPPWPDGTKDLTDYARAGGNVRAWVLALREHHISSDDDPTQLWERVEAAYANRDEREDYYKDLLFDFEIAAEVRHG